MSNSKRSNKRGGSKQGAENKSACDTRDPPVDVEAIIAESAAELSRLLVRKGTTGGAAAVSAPGHTQQPTTAPARRNALTDLIPGYVAPLSLSADLAGMIRAQDTYLRLHKSSLVQEAEMASSSATSRSRAAAMLAPSSAAAPAAASYSKKSTEVHPNSHAAFGGAGRGWFGVEGSTADALESDLRVVRMRNYLDPRRFYKSSDGRHASGVVQVGTIVEGNGIAGSSARLTKKERRANLTEEVMGDEKVQKYLKRKQGEIQVTNSSGNKHWKQQQQDRKYRKKAF